jgi:SAM-dependent methyltransferase
MAFGTDYRGTPRLIPEPPTGQQAYPATGRRRNGISGPAGRSALLGDNQVRVLMTVLILLLLLLPESPGAEPPPGHEGGDHATVHHRFDDAENWAARFEDPARDAWQLPDSVLAVLLDRDDLLVADIGSATGYFPVRFARRLPRGFVYGVDIEPGMVFFLNDRARREGLGNLVSLLAEPDDPHLPRPVDLVFICNTYHHIDDRIDYFARLRENLRPGGRLVVVDYRPESSMGPTHKLDAATVIAELEEAGYELTARHTFLPEQYLLVLAERD